MRAKARDRPFTGGDGRTLICPCGKRLALLWPLETTRCGYSVEVGDGTWYQTKVIHGTFIHGMLNTAHEDWISVVCPKCRHDWQGREGYIGALVAGVAPGQRVTLGDPPRPRWLPETHIRW